MDALTPFLQWIGTLELGPDQLQLLLPLVIGLLSFVMILVLATLIARWRDPVKARIKRAKTQDIESEASTVSEASESFVQMLKTMGASLLPKSAAGHADIKTKLVHAGYCREGRQQSDLQLFLGIKLLFTIAVPLATLFLGPVLLDISGADTFVFALAGAVLGFVLPDLILTQLVKRRRDRLRRALPDAMDLLVVCVEAGNGLSAAIARVAKEMTIAHPDLADELQLVTMQTNAGIDSESALKDLFTRTGLIELKSLVATLIQCLRFGTSIGESLRIYGEELRDKRLQSAQEKAARIGVLIVFPLVLCILPSFFVVVMGPPLIGLARAIGQAFG